MVAGNRMVFVETACRQHDPAGCITRMENKGEILNHQVRKGLDKKNDSGIFQRNKVQVLITSVKGTP
jgi:hypothetical protein